MKKKLMVQIRGKHYEWLFPCEGDPKHIDGWQADGLNIFEVENEIPMWVASVGLTRLWVFLQDLFNFKNPFK